MPPRVPINRRPGALIHILIQLFKYLLGISSVCKALSWCLGFIVAVVKLLSRVQQFVTLWTQCPRLPCPSLSPGICSDSCPLSQILSNHFIRHPLLLLPSIFPRIRVFSSESALYIKWLKYWSFSFSINPSSEYSGLISFRIDWFDVLAVQGLERSKNRCSL